MISRTTGDEANDALPRSPQALRERVVHLSALRQRDQKELTKRQKELAQVQAFLQIAPQVGDALEQINQVILRQMVALLEEKLTIALQEVIEQPLKFRGNVTFKRDVANLDFSVERGAEQEEDILRGQGGSVTNVLSVGLRMFALTTLDEKKHRRFMVLDEQDCWLRPDLVPKLVKIVHEAGKALGFQVLMISHHDISIFERSAERIYRCEPGSDGAVLALVESETAEADAHLAE
jgi:hypothetical protein